MKYYKLVRDRIPEIIKKNKENPMIHIAKDHEYQERLKDKLQEEVNEFLDANSKKNQAEELADILEVILAIGETLKINFIRLEQIRKKKAVERGTFKKRIILEETK